MAEEISLYLQVPQGFFVSQNAFLHLESPTYQIFEIDHKFQLFRVIHNSPQHLNHLRIQYFNPVSDNTTFRHFTDILTGFISFPDNPL